jgi:nickel-dependent lactate racemase
MEIKLAYGKGGMPVHLPDRNVVKCLEHAPGNPLPTPTVTTIERLLAPQGTPPLAELAKGKSSACVLISDITRPVPNEVILPPMLEMLESSGIRREQILILVATGLHRPSTPEERLEMCGEEVVSRYRIEDHHARDDSEHTYLGESPRGVPIWIDSRYLEADLKIATGLIEPHFMAGFSGGRKAICPGIAGQATIARWHSPRFLEHENARNGVLEGNPVHEENTWIAKKAGCDFIVNTVQNADRQLLEIVAGDMEAAFHQGVEHARGLVRATLRDPVDIVVTTCAGYPLDATLYQSVKGVVAAMEILKPGGTIVLAAAMSEGVGSKEFDQIVEDCPTIDDFMQKITQTDYFLLNQWQIEELGQALRIGRVVVVTDGLPKQTVEKYYLQTAPSVEEAVEEALQRYGADATIAVMPEGPYVLAELA